MGTGEILKLPAIAALALLCLLPAAWAQTPAPVSPAERPITLQQALEMASRQNLDLMAARQRRAFALAGIRIARQIPNPSVDFEASRDAPHEILYFTQPLELGGKRGHRTDVARQEQTLTDVEIATTERQVRRAVRETYFSVAGMSAETARRGRVLQLAQRLYEIAQQRFQAGDVAQLEVNQVQLEVARAEVDLRVARQQETISRERLSALLNEPPETVWKPLTRLEEAAPAPPVADLVSRAYQSNSELAHINQELRVERAREGLLRAERVPDLGVIFGGVFNAAPDFRVGHHEGLVMNLRVFTRNQGELQQSSAQQRFLELQSAALRRSVSGEVQAAYYEWDARRAEVELYRNTLRPAAERVEQQAEESYRAGKVNLLTVLEAQRSVQEIEKNYLDSLGALQSAFAALEEITGSGLD
jgi:cobalt-zinc-cadmium efflux system outer membrane protein